MELCGYAEEFLDLSVTTKDGHTRREHMLAAGYSEDELIKSELPAVFFDLWNHFLRLHYTRGSNGFSAMPITYTEIKSYIELNSVEFESWHVSIIKRLDAIALNKLSERK